MKLGVMGCALGLALIFAVAAIASLFFGWIPPLHLVAGVAFTAAAVATAHAWIGGHE